MEDHPKIRVSVLISGNGSNLQALIDAQKDVLQHCTIVRVTSNSKDAHGLKRAKEADIPTTIQSLYEFRKRHPSDNKIAQRSKYDLDLAIALLDDKPDIICCAGWMHVLSPESLDHISSANVPLINLHPALPGAYSGDKAITDAHQDWLNGKISKTGVMIHYVIAEVDMGSPIFVQEIPYMKGVDEDIEKFKEKLHEVEHKAIVEGTKIAVEKLGKATVGVAS